ncbi:hypothetical protein DL93DRAFT_2071580, partial [Clavulina sp. PMI_390]
MFSLLTYLHSGSDDTSPNWVRATYVTPSKGLLPEFLNSITVPPAPAKGYSRIIHVTKHTFIPSLTSDELEKIDNMRMRSNMLKKHPIPRSVRNQVEMVEGAEPETNTMWTMGDVEVFTECGYCRKTVPDMGQCSRCKLVKYCDKECQRLAWPKHKTVCKLSSAKPKGSASTKSSSPSVPKPAAQATSKPSAKPEAQATSKPASSNAPKPAQKPKSTAAFLKALSLDDD